MWETKSSKKDEKYMCKLDDLYDDQKQTMNYILKRFLRGPTKNPLQNKIRKGF